MGVDFLYLVNPNPRSGPVMARAREIAESFRVGLDTEEVRAGIAEKHQFGASSHEIQSLVLPLATALGFESEKRGLFKDYTVASLRPDYYLPLEGSGILLEVERGKTTTNNMDLLDLWKCHICPNADYLFLLVPQARPSANGTVMHHFRDVSRRLETFFRPGNYVNVDGVFLFGY